MDTYNNKCKDELPENTIYKIKEKFYELGLITQETNWLNSVNNFYSLSVSIKGTDISSNGKGTTPTFALASAYAELMERLQNQTFFRLNGNLSDEAFQSEGFYYAPDEIYMSTDQLLQNNNEWLSSQLSKLNKKINKRNLLFNWKSIYFKDIGCDFVCLPYMNVMTNNISYIPINTISKMYMSNGMCAGNTKEEAIVQGLSEVFERVVTCKLINDKLTPPTIPNNYLKKFPKSYHLVKTIRGIKGYELIIKDCSLNKGYPVIGIILIHKNTQSYLVNLGAHPMFEIALERCLTELLQGQNIWQMIGLQEFKANISDNDSHQNLLGILVNGIGHYPNELFSSHDSYDFKPYNNYENMSNKEMMHFMLDILYKQGYHVYIRDVSFLGFPSYHVIVPNFSEIEKIDDVNSVNEYSGFVYMREYIRYLSKLSKKSKIDLIKLFKDNKVQENANVMDLLGIPCNSRMIWYYNDLNLFLSVLHYSIGNFAYSYQYFEQYIKSQNVNDDNIYLYTYYKCVRDYIGLRAKGLNKADVQILLVQFYEEKIIDEVFYHFDDYQNIIKHFGTYECWNCDSCKVKNQCKYPKVEETYKILKAAYNKNCISQENLKHLYI